MTTRYSCGGDEHIFVEVDEEMSLEAFFKAVAITRPAARASIRRRHRDLPGQRLASRSGSTPT